LGLTKAKARRKNVKEAAGQNDEKQMRLNKSTLTKDSSEKTTKGGRTSKKR